MKNFKNNSNSEMGALINNCPPPNKLSTVLVPLSKWTTILILAVMFSTQLIKQSNGQPYYSSSVANSTYSGSDATDATYLSNDVDKTVNGGVTRTFSVTAWGGSHGGIGWAYTDGTNSSTGIQTLPATIANILHPDVCVIKRGTNDYFVVVAYYGSGGGAYNVIATYYEVTVTGGGTTVTWSAATNSTLSTNGGFTTDVNIDADQGDKIAVVWNETVSGDLKLKVRTARFKSGIPTWCTTTSTLPAFYEPGTTTPITYPYLDADIAIYQRNDTTSVATICFLNSSGFPSFQQTLMITSDILFSDLESNSVSAQAVYRHESPANETIQNPRIARHRTFSSHDQLGWTAAYSTYNLNSSVWEIRGITTFVDSTNGNNFIDNGVRTYTDGNHTDYFYNHTGNYLPDIDDAASYLPVISYEKHSGEGDPTEQYVMSLVFQHVDGGNSLPLCIYLQNATGRPYTSAGAAQYYFYKVPYSPAGDEVYVTVAGLESKYFHYAWAHQTSPYTVEYKLVEAKANLRTMQNEIPSEIPALVFSDSYSLPFNMPVDFKAMEVYNTSGSVVKKINNIDAISSLFSQLSSGLYIARFAGEDGSILTRKLIIKK